MKNLFLNKFQKFLAFTLAEVVLVLGIIGVVGVLGVANAKKDTDTAEKVAMLKKTYGILETAFSQAVMENGSIDRWGTNGAYPTNAEIWSVVKPYLQLNKNCNTEPSCWKDAEPIGIDKEASNTNINRSTDFEKAILSNGVSIALFNDLSNFFSNNFEEQCPILLVDVNAKKGLNMFGNDIFAFVVNVDGTVEPLSDPNSSNDINDVVVDVYRTAWVIKFGNMDYLKSCKADLSWTGNHTCR